VASCHYLAASYSKFPASFHSKKVTEVDFSEEYSATLASGTAARIGLVKLDDSFSG
jgi:hypothetical protein